MFAGLVYLSLTSFSQWATNKSSRFANIHSFKTRKIKQIGPNRLNSPANPATRPSAPTQAPPLFLVPHLNLKQCGAQLSVDASLRACQTKVASFFFNCLFSCFLLKILLQISSRIQSRSRQGLIHCSCASVRAGQAAEHPGNQSIRPVAVCI